MNIGKSTKIALAMAGENTAWLGEQMSVNRQRAWNLTRNREANGSTIVKLSKVFELKTSDFIALGED